MVKTKKPLRARFLDLPVVNPKGLRDCQIRAITNLEKSFKESRPRALIQMATGSGKTFTAITSVYRLLKYANAKRILFLVDTKNLGEQAEQEFRNYAPIDDNRLFTELYNVHRLQSNYIPTDSHVCISTIQRLYSILKGEELDESAEELNPNELIQPRQPLPVVYNAKLPIEFFDFIVIDECHRSIYNVWKQVLEYFDAFLVGLTATPDKRTFGFFNENIVSEYPHEQAVVDGVNVGYDVYNIDTEITSGGARIQAEEYIDKRDKLTRKKRWAQLDEDYAYAGKQLDKDVVNPSQIRTIIRTFKDKLHEIFPNRQEVPKTLIFAKDDSHADDIIQAVREQFAEGNDFCKKVTYKAKEDPKTILADFRNSYNPRIAVTVDMIATGTDVKPIECLIFMRDVRSRNYFEQMKGRGTRTLEHDDLKKVTPSATSAKTHFVIVDAVGVSRSLKTDSRPLERKPSVPLKDLMMGIMIGAQDEDSFTSLAGRLARLDKEMTPTEKDKLIEITGGSSVSDFAKLLLAAYDPDKIVEKAQTDNNLSTDVEPSGEQLQQAQQIIIKQAAKQFNGTIIDYLDNVRKVHDQIIDIVNIDQVSSAGWAARTRDKDEEIIQEFKQFIELHKDEITALKIYYNIPFQQRKITYGLIKELLDTLKLKKPHLMPLRIWQAYQHIDQVNGKNPVNDLTAIVALVRRVVGIDTKLTDYGYTVDKNFKDWLFKKQAGALKFTEEQMLWLRLIKEHIVDSFSIERTDFDLAPFDAKGGIGKMYQLFGKQTDDLIQELNAVLAA